MTNKAKIGAGNVEIELDGETVTLKPTLRAAQTISRQAGGIMAAVERIGKFDLDVLTQVVALGLGREPKDVADAVWRTGMADLSAPVINFLSVLANGGRPIQQDEGGEGADDPQK